MFGIVSVAGEGAAGVTLRGTHAGAVHHWVNVHPWKTPALIGEVLGGLSPVEGMTHCCRGGIRGVFLL